MSKLCIDCQFCVLQPNKNGIDELDFDCSHEKSGRKSLINGQHIMESCVSMRNDMEDKTLELCGSKAKFFKKKVEK